MSSNDNSTIPIVLRGSCACKSVSWASTELPRHLNLCHCTICRKVSGAPFLPFGHFNRRAVTWDTSANTIKESQYSEVAVRGFCTNCGTPLYIKYHAEPDQTNIAMGTVDEDSIVGDIRKQDAHLYVLDNASWYEIDEYGVQRQVHFFSTLAVLELTWFSQQEATRGLSRRRDR